MDNQELIEENVSFESEVICEDVINIVNTEDIKIFGTPEQRKEMFSDWSKYFGEITNPDNTTLNTFFKAKYAPLSEVLNTLRPIMSKYGLTIIQTPYISNDNVCVRSIVTHKSGAIMAFPQASGKPTKNDIQGFGSTVSYLRRFAVNAIAGVMGEVDDDGNSAGKPKEPSEEDVALQKTQENILKMATEKIENGIDKETVYKIISDNNDGKKNPNAIKDIEIAKKVLAEIKKLKVQKNKTTEEGTNE